MKAPEEKMQICSFLWVYYGYPASSYEDTNVEAVRYQCGIALAKNDNTDEQYNGDYFEKRIDFGMLVDDSVAQHMGYYIPPVLWEIVALRCIRRNSKLH